MAPVVPQKKEEDNPEEKLVFDNAPEPAPEPVPETEPVVEPVPEPVQEEFKPVANREPTPYKPRELIVEEEFVAKPKAPRLEEEDFDNEMLLVPVVKRSRTKRSASKTTKKTHKYKRCKNNHRRNPKTHRCNTKCPPGKKKNATNKRCINKGGKKCLQK
jgi:hypothetical protein